MLNKRNNLIFNAFLIIGPLITFTITTTMIFFTKNIDLVLLCLAPLFYYLIYIKIAKIHKYYMFPAIGLLNIICYIRYLIIPLLYAICSDMHSTPNNIFSGVVLFLFEEITVGLFVAYLTRYKYAKLANSGGIDNDNIKFTNLDSRIRFAFIVICLYALYIIISQPIYIGEFHFVFFNDNVSMDVNYGDANTLIIELAKIVFPVILSAFFCEQYQTKHKNIYYFITIIIVLLFNVFIVKSLSRNTIIFPAVASIYYLIRIFPQKKKTTLVIIGGISVIALSSLTIVKTNYGSGSHAINNIHTLLTTLQNYYMGPDDLALAITAKNEFSASFTIHTVLNDLFYNVPGISHFFNGVDRTNTIFNIVKGTQSHVIPLIGQGAFYFGYFFSYLLNFICIGIVSVIDRNYYKARNLVEIYIYSYFAITLMHSSIHNISNFSASFFGRALPLIIISRLPVVVRRRIVPRKK